MFNIYICREYLFNGFSEIFIVFISLLSILMAVSVIISKNPIVSILFLIGLFLSISGYLMLVGYNFIGLSYLLVYVGAVSILFLFILMLINIRVSELVTETNNGIPLAIFIGIIFNYTSREMYPDTNILESNDNFNTLDSNSRDASSSLYPILKTIFSIRKLLETFNRDFLATSVTWDNNLSEQSHITAIGNVLYTSYPMWIILTSIILLLAMVGAIVITIKPKNVN